MTTQIDTGLPIAAFGNLPGWTKSGFNAVHAVETSPGDYSIMLYDSNSITLQQPINANNSDTTYLVSFTDAPAVFQIASQETSAADYMDVDILNSSNAIIASDEVFPGAWTGAATNPFEPGSFTYTGTGSGPVTIEISSGLHDGCFSGAIDDLAITAVPEPSSLGLLGSGLVLVCLIRRRRNLNRADTEALKT